MLEDKVRRVGGIVHWAREAEEACEIITNIALKNGVKSIVKSKSMASEEIELNEFLERAGIKAVETDLGEYIIQLAKERPSHIIAPAIHKTKEEIGELFAEKLNVECYDEPERLTQIARERLRSEFLNAGMGVTGANFGVAETGTIVLVENEGNIRLTTTVPPIHIVLMGIEKVIPSIEDLAIFLKLLVRSASGQRMSSYVSFITGSRRIGDVDGPREFHLVLLDNGRSKILANEELRESLYCIRCGACLNVCPVYQKVGGHSYGWVYSGPIGAIITPQLLSLQKARELPYASSLCGACAEVCPVKINIPKVLLELRSEIAGGKNSHEGVRAGWLEKLGVRLWCIAMGNKEVYSFVSSLAYLLQLPFMRDGRLRSLPYPFSRWTKGRDFPAVAKKTFRERWKEIKKQ